MKIHFSHALSAQPTEGINSFALPKRLPLSPRGANTKNLPLCITRIQYTKRLPLFIRGAVGVAD